MDIRIIKVSESPATPKKLSHPHLLTVGTPRRLGIYIRAKVLSEVFDVLAGDTRVERGGVLLGDACVDGTARYVEITDHLKAVETEESSVHMKFTVASWERIEAELEARYPRQEKRVVGWYHSHPNLGVFVSGNDEEVHKLFRSWYHSALVVDPVKRDLGFFDVDPSNQRLCPSGGFHVFYESEDELRELRRRTGELVAPRAGEAPTRLQGPERSRFSFLFLALGLALFGAGAAAGATFERRHADRVQAQQRQEFESQLRRSTAAVDRARKIEEEADHLNRAIRLLACADAVRSVEKAGAAFAPLGSVPLSGLEAALSGAAWRELARLKLLSGIAPGLQRRFDPARR